MSTSLLLNLIEQSGQLAQQVNIVQTNVSILLEDRGRASESRKSIHEKLDAQGNRLTACEEQLDNILPTIKRLEETVDRLETSSNMTEGEKRAKRRLFDRGKATWTLFLGAGGITGIWHEWDKFHHWIFKLFK